MATAERSWRDRITPAMRERIDAHKAELEKASKVAPEWPADVTPNDITELSIAARHDPSITIWDIVGSRGRQGALELHLNGGGVEHHGVDAKAFTAFISRLTEAVNEITAHALNIQRHTSRLQLAAIQPGSFAFELRAPDGVKPPKAQGSSYSAAGSSADSDALRVVATVLANGNGDEDALGSTAAALTPSARAKLRTAMTTAKKQGWTFSGTLRERGFSPMYVDLSAEEVERIRDALEDSSEPKRERVTVRGTISGFKREENLVWIRVGDNRIPASPDSLEVMRDVRAAAAHEEVRVEADLLVETRPSKTNPATLITRRALMRLVVLNEQPDLFSTLDTV